MAQIISSGKLRILEVDNNDVVDRVEKTVLENNGKGFTIQVIPEISKYKILNGHVPLLGKKYLYRPAVFGSYEVDSAVQIFAGDLSVQWNAVISKEIGKVGNELPTGIAIEKSEIVILHDERIKEDWRPKMSFDHKGASYVEGRRVYISVSDEYAAKVFKEVFMDPGVKFRDVLLTKYEHILQAMASLIQNHSSFKILNQFFVDDTHVGWSSGIAGKNAHYINTNHYDDDSAIPFKKFDMRPIESLGQKYGMALAIIETLKNNDLKYENAVFTMQYGFYCCGNSKSIKVDIQIIPQTVLETPHKLNPW